LRRPGDDDRQQDAEDELDSLSHIFPFLW